MDSEQDKILAMVEEGTISAEEAQEMLQALEETEEPEPAADMIWPDLPQHGQSWQKPFNMALAGTLFGSLMLLMTRKSSGCLGMIHKFVFWPLTLLAGVAAVITYFSKDSPWLHVRVKSEGEADFKISLPFPANAMNKALRVARSRAPNEDVQQKIDMAAEILTQMDTSNLKDPLVIDINDDGDKVQVYLY